MTPGRSRLLARLHAAERVYDAVARRVTPSHDWRVGVQPYRTAATADSIDLHCRVLRRTALTEPTAADPWWRNVINVYQQFETDEVPGATVLATDGIRSTTLTTDEEGYATGHWTDADPPPRPGHNRIEYRVLETPMGRPHPHASTTTSIRPDPAAEIGLISDIDDTVLHSEATSPLRTIYWVAFHNSFSRQPIDGVVPLYQKLTPPPPRLWCPADVLCLQQPVEPVPDAVPIHPPLRAACRTFVSARPWPRRQRDRAGRPFS